MRRTPTLPAAVSTGCLLLPAVLAAVLLAGCGDGRGGAASETAAGGGTPTTDDTPAPTRSADRSRVENNPEGWPPIELEPPVLDFGILEPGGVGRGSVRIWNVGQQPLRVLRAATSCGCTTTDSLDGRVIQPGGSTEFTTNMELKSGLGEKREMLRVLFEGYNRPVSYAFRAEASLMVRATPPHLTAVDAETEEVILEGQLDIASRDGRPFRILATAGSAPQYVDYDPRSDPPRDRYQLRWDLRAMDAQNAVPWFWMIETDHPEAPVVDVRIRHPETKPTRPQGRPWVPKDQRALLGILVPGITQEITAKLEYNPRSRPEPATAAARSDTTELFDVQLVDAVAEGQFIKFRLRVTPLPGPAGLVYGKATLSASGFDMPLYLIGRRE
ncbi:MAG: DUF1573 domain-containing protein [Planctomycetota bacterium]|jgi:hypothetical protein